jgi:hypothetical protein
MYASNTSVSIEKMSDGTRITSSGSSKTNAASALK